MSVPAAAYCDIHFGVPSLSIVHLFLWKSFCFVQCELQELFFNGDLQHSSVDLHSADLIRAAISDVQTLPWVPSSCHC
jgi:hypothetical protein